MTWLRASTIVDARPPSGTRSCSSSVGSSLSWLTAERRGKGMIVLFHVNADTSWSNLPISGLFVDMLKRIVDLSPQAAPSSEGDDATDTKVSDAGDARTFTPRRTLDGFGALGEPSPYFYPIDSRVAWSLH